MTLLKVSSPLSARFLRDKSRLDISKYDGLVVCVKFIIWRILPSSIPLAQSSIELCVRLPPDLCMLAADKSAPHSIADGGHRLEK